MSSHYLAIYIYFYYINDNSFLLSLQIHSRMFYGRRNAAQEVEERAPWVAPDDANGSDVDIAADDSDDDPDFIPDEELCAYDAFDAPNTRG